MSYPKKATGSYLPPTNGSQASMNGSQYGGSGSFSKTQKRREQLHTLLVNKFRGKDSIDIDSDANLDRVIRAEVARFLEAEQMTEANLIKLDKRLAEVILKQGTGSTTGSAIGQRKREGSAV